MTCSRCGFQEPNQSCYVCALSDEELARQVEHEELAADYWRDEIRDRQWEEENEKLFGI